MVPVDSFLQEQHGKDDKYAQGDDLLEDLQLEAVEMLETQAVGRYGQTVLEQRDAPGHQNGFPQRPLVPVLQMAVPGERHEEIRADQQQGGVHEMHSYRGW